METLESLQEQERVRKLGYYRKIFLFLWLKHWPVSLSVFLLALGGGLGLVALNVYRAEDRFTASSKLFFYPRQNAASRAMDVKQAQELFRRQAVLQRTGEALAVPEGERYKLNSQIGIEFDKNKPNLIAVAAKAGSRDFAVKLVNAFIGCCIDEYRTFRGRELAGQMKALGERKKELEAAILACEQTQQEMVKSYGALTPVQELERLRKVVSDELAMLSEINIQCANEEARKKKLEEQLQDTNPHAMQYARQLKDFLADQERLAKELVRLQQLYTDKNPKIRVVASELEYARQSYRDFLERNRISTFAPENLALWDEIQKNLTATREKLDFLYENREALKQEIDLHQKAVTGLMAVMPAYNEAGLKRNSLVALLQTAEESIGELQLLITAVDGDVIQVEEATGAYARPLLGKEAFAGCLMLALWCTALAGVLLVWAEYTFGKIRDGGELACFPGLKLLGGYPDDPAGKAEQDTAVKKIGHEILAVSAGKHILFEAALEGGAMVPAIREALEWDFKMNGTKFFRLHIGQTQKISAESPALPLAAIQKFGDSGVMPVENPRNLSPAEQELMKSDIRKLLETYDLVIVNRDGALTANELLFRQMLEFCDYSLLYFRAGRTPRRLLRLIMGLHEKTRCTVLAIVAGIRDETSGGY